MSDVKKLTPEERLIVSLAVDALTEAITEKLTGYPTWAIAQALTMMGIEQYVYIGVQPLEYATLSASFWRMFEESMENGDVLRALPTTNGQVH